MLCLLIVAIIDMVQLSGGTRREGGAIERYSPRNLLSAVVAMANRVTVSKFFEVV
jgi:hypothetical protein